MLVICFPTITYVAFEQTQIVAAAAANVAAEGLSPRTARVEAEAAAALSMSLAENALVLLMLVEDHLRLESQYFYSTIPSSSDSGGDATAPILTSVPSRRHSAIGIEVRKPPLDNSASRRLSITSDSTGSLSLEVLFHLLCFRASGLSCSRFCFVFLFCVFICYFYFFMFVCLFFFLILFMYLL